MEHAITSVEDEIAQTPAELLAGSNLFTTDTAIHEVALVAGLAHQPAMLLNIAEVERIFDRLTYVVEGRPAPSEGLPESSEFSTTLLILREFMHHQGFSSITVVS